MSKKAVSVKIHDIEDGFEEVGFAWKILLASKICYIHIP